MAKSSGERTLLSGALSIEFSDCSVAAADLNHVVGELMTYGKKSNMTIVGEAEDYRVNIASAHNNDNYRYTARDDINIVLDGHQTKFLLAQRISKDSLAGHVKDRRRSFLGRQVKVENAVEQTVGDPFLAVVVGQDALLPLASFARRSGGNCDYVQLGQEMEDDNFYVTAADEYAHRHELVEAFRGFVKNEDLADQQKELLQVFVDSQVRIHRAELDASYEVQLAQFAESRLNQSSMTRRLAVLDGDRPTVLSHSTYNLIPPLVTGVMKGRTVSFDLIRPENTTGTATVVAITRESLALPLINLNPEWGQVETLVPMDDSLKAQTVRNLLELVGMEPFRPTSFHGSGITAVYLENVGLAKKNPDWHGNPKVKSDECRKFDEYFAYPRLSKPPTEESAFSNVIQSFYSARRAHFESLLRGLRVEEAFTELLGKAEESQERLFHYLGRLALRPEGKMNAVFRDMKINNTSGDVSIEVEVTPEHEAYKLLISGRPRAMTDEPLKPLISAWINPASKQPIQSFDERPLSKADEAEITDILARIYSVRLS